ncbi:MAG: hypothetical protein QOI50_1616, partial [Pseudonocardiales bacterium]|nr:hypothetical protein [Pseudonocardiales bacterium]
YTVIGSGAVLGVSAFVHYGVTMAEGTVLDSDTFLMKGEQTAPFTRWGGNPATEVRPVARPATATPITSVAAPTPAVQAGRLTHSASTALLTRNQACDHSGSPRAS